MNIERILWLDHHAPAVVDQYHSLEAILEGAKQNVVFENYGVILHENDEAVTIAGQKILAVPDGSGEGYYGGVVQTIMKALIVEREVLKEDA